MPNDPPSKLDSNTVKPTFNDAAAPKPPVKPDEPKPELKPSQPQGPSPTGPGSPQISPQLKDQKDEQAKKDEFKKKMLLKQEFNKKARGHTPNRGR